MQSAGRATCRLGRDLVTLCQAAFALPTVTASPWGARLGKPGSGVQLKARDLGLDSGLALLSRRDLGSLHEAL